MAYIFTIRNKGEEFIKDEMKTHSINFFERCSFVNGIRDELNNKSRKKRSNQIYSFNINLLAEFIRHYNGNMNQKLFMRSVDMDVIRCHYRGSIFNWSISEFNEYLIENLTSRSKANFGEFHMLVNPCNLNHIGLRVNENRPINAGFVVSNIPPNERVLVELESDDIEYLILFLYIKSLEHVIPHYSLRSDLEATTVVKEVCSDKRVNIQILLDWIGESWRPKKVFKYCSNGFCTNTCTCVDKACKYRFNKHCSSFRNVLLTMCDKGYIQNESLYRRVIEESRHLMKFERLKQDSDKRCWND